MSGALGKIKKKLNRGKLFAELMNEVSDLKEEQERTNDLLKKILKEVQGHAD